PRARGPRHDAPVRDDGAGAHAVHGLTLGPRRERAGNSHEPCDAGSSLPKRRCQEDETTYRSRVARTWPRLPDYGMKTNFDSKQRLSRLTNALTSRRLEQTKDQPLRSVPNTDNGDSHAVPTSSQALFVIPRGRGGGFKAS